ncbi:MAG TPA: PSD1 and planctomycete cytochrome C domain-containing protein [Verrucomicrobiae bacterium]|nr:PSD1 and planctomycete cytochrome C domain-containing protein [Verrucomicrobiae bacterium]
MLAATDYQQDIKPILRDRCYSCHSRLKQKSDLRLDAGALILKGGKHGAVVVPGNAGASPLIEKIAATAEDERMPPEGKPLTPEQVALLKGWIDSGAYFPKDEIIPPTPAEHWAFQPVSRPPVPAVKNKSWPRNPIDSFVLAKLEGRQWKPSTPAAPHALLRRVHLDLTGLPPTLAEQDAFLKNPSPAALDKVIDDLLTRPAYGERWARHWLDVVRYADSNGYERDAEKPFVWRYRDYVINSLNADKPFDRFVREQLAGDELPDANAETVIATGFLRLGHWDDEPADPATDRFDQLDDIVSTTAQAFLGLTLACARCHDHKFEPFTQRDYYGMVAVFNPLERPRNGRTELTLPAGDLAQLAALAERDKKIAELKKQTNTLAAAEIERRIASLREATPDLPQAYCLHEPSPPPPPTHVLIRGSASRPGAEVPPLTPAVFVKRQPTFPAPSSCTSQRRLGVADWIASPDNPLTARVQVNRVWQQHFGHGLVRTPNDFGLMGEAPTHTELLDWLADWFVHEGGWSLKKLHRLILGSAAWRQGVGALVISNQYSVISHRRPAPMTRTASTEHWKLITDYSSNPHGADPDNRFLWHFTHRRLEVEAIRDSMLAVSGQLNPKMFGPAMKPRIPLAALEANTDKESIWKPSDESEASRRTIYTFIKRGLVVPMLEVLDLGDTVHSCPQRQVTTVAPQALSLFNGEFVNQQARRFAARLEREAGSEPRKQIELAFRLALCRPPTKVETATLMEFCRERLGQAGLEQVCRVILNLNEFVYSE